MSILLGARHADKIKVFTDLRLTVPRGQQKISSHIKYSMPCANDRGGSKLKKHLPTVCTLTQIQSGFRKDFLEEIVMQYKR